ncbi:MAG: hypothetical protein AB8H79_14490, partial [Myxococcota bacterium]
FAWSGRTPWPAALGVAGLFGVPGLGALLADAGPGVVGWTSPIVWAGAALVGVIGVGVGRP